MGHFHDSQVENEIESTVQQCHRHTYAMKLTNRNLTNTMSLIIKKKYKIQIANHEFINVNLF